MFFQSFSLWSLCFDRFPTALLLEREIILKHLNANHKEPKFAPEIRNVHCEGRRLEGLNWCLLVSLHKKLFCRTKFGVPMKNVPFFKNLFCVGVPKAGEKSGFQHFFSP